MSYKFTTVETRQDLSVDFYMFPQIYLELAMPYRQNQKLISTSMEYSDDMLSLVRLVEWDSKESWQAFVDIPEVKQHLEIRDSYNALHNITLVKTEL